jgi:hypothetical protein
LVELAAPVLDRLAATTGAKARLDPPSFDSAPTLREVVQIVTAKDTVLRWLVATVRTQLPALPVGIEIAGRLVLGLTALPATAVARLTITLVTTPAEFVIVNDGHDNLTLSRPRLSDPTSG